MSEKNFEILQEEIEGILSNNMSFYRNSPEDKSQYYVDFETVIKLVYEIMQHAITLFGFVKGIAETHRWITSKKNVIENENDNSIAVSDNESFRKKLGILRMNMNDEKLKAELKIDIQKILEYHGWPMDEANSDSEKILKSFIDINNLFFSWFKNIVFRPHLTIYYIDNIKYKLKPEKT